MGRFSPHFIFITNCKKQKPKELTIEEQLEEFSDIIVSLILKSNLWEESEENQKQVLHQLIKTLIYILNLFFGNI
jgi:hypothetical protein